MLTITISSLFHKDELYLWILQYDENICVYVFKREEITSMDEHKLENI